MQQKCAICHFEKPNPEMKNKMIAPPLVRIQEHYKPAYQNKTDFVNAVVNYTFNPNPDKTLMPGTIKKFGLMPKLNYDKNEVKSIAELLYDIDFGKITAKGFQNNINLELNNGQKWKLKPESVEMVHNLISNIENLKSGDIKDYNKLGKDIFDKAKQLMLDKDYKDKKADMIHGFFHTIEEPMHNLMGAKDTESAEKYLQKLKENLSAFDTYFE